jgi:DNA-binding NtrC family response regulator
MTTPRPTILIIDDEVVLTNFLKGELEREGYTVMTEASTDAGIASATRGMVDVVVTDLHFAPENYESREGFQFIREVHSAKPDLPVILMTSDKATEHAIEAIKLGAFDYIAKPPDPREMLPDLLDLINEAINASRPLMEPQELGGEAPAKDTIIGTSREIREVCKEIGRDAPTAVTVLILGETGTGKELVARAIHRHSERLGKPFITVNCAAIAETLIESELFGHVRGAFTGADHDRVGRFELAQRGTLFLDEIGDMSSQTQAKLLRVLQEKVIQRVGGNQDIPVDVRVIAATHHDLEREIRENRFRRDLYYRLNKAVIKLPPLRERTKDIPELVRFFIKRHAGELHLVAPSISEDAFHSLQEQPWPGNVRELENVVCKALLLARGRAITHETILNALGKTDVPRPIPGQTLAGHISELLDRAISGQLENAEAALTWDTEYELYKQALHRANDNQAKAARWLGVSRTTMRQKLKLYGLRAAPDNSST